MIERRNARLENFIRDLDLPLIRLFYEDLLLQEQETLRRICLFLNVRPIRGSCVKNTSDDLREVLENFEELKSHYIGTS